MSLPHLLLVDDSDAILNFEKAVLSGLYRLSTAGNGVEALERIKQFKPDCVLLDLSMPEMDGDEVLRIVKSDPVYSHIPFLIISSEKDRAEACLKAGAEGLLNKPVVADELKARVALILEEAAEKERKRKSAFLFFQVGSHELGIPLAGVLSVHSQPATRARVSSFVHLSREVDYYGEPVKVLDLAGVLGVPYGQPLEDRKLIFVQQEEKLAFCVDRVWDPEELLPEQITALKGNGKEAGDSPVFESEVEVSRGTVAILKMGSFFSVELLSQLTSCLKQQEGRSSREINHAR